MMMMMMIAQKNKTRERENICPAASQLSKGISQIVLSLNKTICERNWPLWMKEFVPLFS
jgi:hypothetical protein